MSVWLELKPEPTLFLATLLDLYYMEPFYGLELFCITCLFGEYIYIYSRVLEGYNHNGDNMYKAYIIQSTVFTMLYSCIYDHVCAHMYATAVSRLGQICLLHPFHPFPQLNLPCT